MPIISHKCAVFILISLLSVGFYSRDELHILHVCLYVVKKRGVSAHHKTVLYATWIKSLLICSGLHPKGLGDGRDLANQHYMLQQKLPKHLPCSHSYTQIMFLSVQVSDLCVYLSDRDAISS